MHTETIEIATVDQAATMAGVTPRTMKKWLKKPMAPRHISGPTGKVILIKEEVQEWLDTVISRKKTKKTWKKALRRLKNLQLIDRTPVEDLLKKLKEKEWTPIQRKVNGFDDSHIEAYRRGVSDALYALRRQGAEAWDYVPELGQSIGVGGCGGLITKISDTHVFVSGYYTYSNGSDDDPGHREHWRFSYLLEDITAREIKPLPVFRRDGRLHVSWDYEKIPHNSYA